MNVVWNIDQLAWNVGSVYTDGGAQRRKRGRGPRGTPKLGEFTVISHRGSRLYSLRSDWGLVISVRGRGEF